MTGQLLVGRSSVKNTTGKGIKNDVESNSSKIKDETYLQYVYPSDLFDLKREKKRAFWTCVRTKPRWEKRMVRYLKRRNETFFLPVISRNTFSGRKKRASIVPLFAGFVFVQGNYSKQSFKDSGSVVYVIRPRTVKEEEKLDEDIRKVWTTIAKGINPKLENKYDLGEKVKVLSGPLEGVTGEIVKKGPSKRLTIWVNMLGVGASVEIGEDIKLDAITVS